VFLYERYFESAVGRTKPLKSNWFTGIGWRASAVVPAHDHLMEYYALSMATFDPTLLAVGGFTNGTVGHESRVERFARVYRQLPAGQWHELPDPGNDVVGRTTERQGVWYVYLVNRNAEPRPAVIADGKGLKPIGDSPALSNGTGGWHVTLAPYQLAAWRREATR